MNFQPRTVSLAGTIVLDGRVDDVFPLFSPLGEEKWVDGWAPQILFPPGADWSEGMVFRTFSEGQEEIWVVADLDLKTHRVVYYRVEPGSLVARVEVRCQSLGSNRTEAATSYSYVSLSNAGDEQLAQWTDAAYAAKMDRWQKSINEYLRKAIGG